MFRSVKLKNLRLTVFSLVCLLIFVAVCVLALRAGAPDTVTIDGESYSLRAEDDEDIAAFLQICGRQATEKLSDTPITVPKHWNDTYEQYSALQTAQGFDLVPYKGKQARELMYACGDDAAVTLLLSGNRIIAAHIAAQDGGEMRPLIMN